MSSDLTLPVRITAARRLLSEEMEEYHDLPSQCQAHLQEAIEFLTQVETQLEGYGTDLEGNGNDLEGDGEKKKSCQSSERSSTEHWPTYDLTYTFNPEDIGCWTSFEPDEVVIHDPDGEGATDRWISAKRNAYLPIEELR